MKPDFSRPNKTTIDWYDLFEDWELIESSFAEQYGIRLRHEKYMPWNEFSALLSGISHKTALGQIIQIRSEKDPERLKHFTPEHQRIRRDWISRQTKKQIETNPEAVKRKQRELQAAFKAAFS